jgi:hypothetical protein
VNHLDAHLTPQVDYKIGAINLAEREPTLTHYAEAIKAIAWKRQKIE